MWSLNCVLSARSACAELPSVPSCVDKFSENSRISLLMTPDTCSMRAVWVPISVVACAARLAMSSIVRDSS